MPHIDFEYLFKLRLTVARYDEMDNARWWNTTGILGRYGVLALSRGLPRTHYFAQARIAFAVASQRCRDVYSHPGAFTLWEIPASIEDRFKEKWHDWLDDLDRWTPFFHSIEGVFETDFLTLLEKYDLISSDPMAPGTVYSATVNAEGTVGMYRIEVSISPGTGRLKMAGGVSGTIKESIQRAYGYLAAKKGELGLAQEVNNSDFYVEVLDLLNNKVQGEVGVAFFIAVFSAIRKSPATPATLIMGDMSIQGNIKPARSLVEPLQVAKDNGAKRALIPIENKRNFLDVDADIMEHVDPVFYGEPRAAALKALNLS